MKVVEQLGAHAKEVCIYLPTVHRGMYLSHCIVAAFPPSWLTPWESQGMAAADLTRKLTELLDYHHHLRSTQPDWEARYVLPFSPAMLSRHGALRCRQVGKCAGAYHFRE